jgi:hypothetical protein
MFAVGPVLGHEEHPDEAAGLLFAAIQELSAKVAVPEAEA